VPGAPSPAFVPIRIFGEDTEVHGWMAPPHQRMTDLLQQGIELSFLPAGAPDLPESWVRLAPDELRMVVPPPHVSPPELRVARPMQGISIRIGSYLVTGTARLRAGQEHDPFLRATQPFLPLTGASILREGLPPEMVDVLIVNLRWAEEINSL
jgi:hypothetical protein